MSPCRVVVEVDVENAGGAGVLPDLNAGLPAAEAGDAEQGLEGDPCRVADVAVVVSEVCQRGLDRGRILLSVEGLERSTQLAEAGELVGNRLGRCGRGLAGVGDPEEF